MRSYCKELWFDVLTRRAFINITPQMVSCRRSEAPCDLSAIAQRATAEAKNAILPCGNLPAVLRTALQAGPQGFAYSAEAKPLAAKAGLAKKGKTDPNSFTSTLLNAHTLT